LLLLVLRFRAKGLMVGIFAEFLFDVPPVVYEIDPEKHTANIIGHGNAPISFTSYEESATFLIQNTYSSMGNFVVAILLQPAETRNKVIRVEGQQSSWDEIISILEKLQGTKYSVKYTSIVEAEPIEEDAWEDGNPAAFRLNLRRCMGTGNAKLEPVDNGMFPEVKVTTDLEAIAKKTLIKKGLLQ